LTTFLLEDDFQERMAILINARRGQIDFSKIEFLAGTKKTIFAITQTPSFSAKRGGKRSSFRRTRKSGLGVLETGQGRELAENGPILKISGRLGVAR
jgi:hypothetical protein